MSVTTLRATGRINALNAGYSVAESTGACVFVKSGNHGRYVMADTILDLDDEHLLELLRNMLGSVK